MASIASAGPAAAGGNSSQNRETQEFRHYPDEEHSRSMIPAGRTSPAAASVRVPRSYFVRVARGDGPAEPDEATIKLRTKEEQIRIRDAVTKCVGLANAADVSVESYFDQAPAVPPIAAASTASAVTLALGGHVKEIALGGLALASLFMVSTIVRRGAPSAPARKPASRSAEVENNAVPTLGGEALAGEAGDGGVLMDGMELDEDTVRTRQMLQQVSTLVDDNPDTAAALVRRWLNRT